MRPQKSGIEIRVLDGSGQRCAVLLDGLVRYVGSAEQCRQRAEILMPRGSDRDRQDEMLLRAMH